MLRPEINDATIRLRDGAVMRTLHIGGMEFETQDADQLDHAQAVREVLLRSVLDARFAGWSRDAPFPIELVDADAVELVRAALLGGTPPLELASGLASAGAPPPIVRSRVRRKPAS